MGFDWLNKPTLMCVCMYMYKHGQNIKLLTKFMLKKYI